MDVSVGIPYSTAIKPAVLSLRALSQSLEMQAQMGISAGYTDKRHNPNGKESPE